MVLEEEADIDVGLTCFSIVSASAHTKMKAVAIKSKGGRGTGGPTTFAAGRNYVLIKNVERESYPHFSSRFQKVRKSVIGKTLRKCTT